MLMQASSSQYVCWVVTRLQPLGVITFRPMRSATRSYRARVPRGGSKCTMMLPAGRRTRSAHTGWRHSLSMAHQRITQAGLGSTAKAGIRGGTRVQVAVYQVVDQHHLQHGAAAQLRQISIVWRPGTHLHVFGDVLSGLECLHEDLGAPNPASWLDPCHCNTLQNLFVEAPTRNTLRQQHPHLRGHQRVDWVGEADVRLLAEVVVELPQVAALLRQVNLRQTMLHVGSLGWIRHTARRIRLLGMSRQKSGAILYLLLQRGCKLLQAFSDPQPLHAGDELCDGRRGHHQLEVSGNGFTDAWVPHLNAFLHDPIH
jgi:hypothetical protein